MNNKNILIINDNSEYYGNINYRLLLVMKPRDFYKHVVSLGIVDDEYKEYSGFNVPSTIKESLKYKDKISFHIQYEKAFRDILGSYKFITGNEFDVYNYLIYGIIDKDNLNWSAKGTLYEEACLKIGHKPAKKIPFGTTEKQIERFYKKNGNYFPLYDFKTNEEAKAYIEVL